MRWEGSPEVWVGSGGISRVGDEELVAALEQPPPPGEASRVRPGLEEFIGIGRLHAQAGKESAHAVEGGQMGRRQRWLQLLQREQPGEPVVVLAKPGNNTCGINIPQARHALKLLSSTLYIFRGG